MFSAAKLAPSQWYLAWWPWWVKQLDALGFNSEAHLRKAMPINQHVLTDDLRLWHFPVVSSYALVHLLTRWSNKSKSKKAKDSDQRETWTMLARGIFASCVDQARLYVIKLYLDIDAECVPGLPLRGSNPASLPLKGSLVDLRPLLGSGLEAATSACRLLGCFDDASAVPLLFFLNQLDISGKGARWLYKQVIWNVGCLLDSHLFEGRSEMTAAAGVVDDCPVSPESLLMGRSESSRRKREAKLATRCQMAMRPVGDVCMRLLKLFFAIRMAFSNLRSFSFAVDATRVGGLNRFLSFVARPAGEGALLPPLASQHS